MAFEMDPNTDPQKLETLVAYIRKQVRTTALFLCLRSPSAEEGILK